MANTSNPLIGKASGSVGGVTFSTWKGVNVIKSKPTTVTQTSSLKRDMRQAALAQMVSMFRMLSNSIDTTYKSLAKRKSAYNAFASYNLKNAFDYSSPPAATIIPLQIKVSRGTIARTQTQGKEISIPAKSCIATYPTSVIGAKQKLTDRAVVFVWNQTKGTWEGITTNATRADGSFDVTLTNEYGEEDVCFEYVCFVSEIGNLTSDNDADLVEVTT